MFTRSFWAGKKERTPLSTIVYVHNSIEYSVCGHAYEREIAVPFIFVVVASLVDSFARPILVRSVALNYCDLSRRSQSGRYIWNFLLVLALLGVIAAAWI